MKHLKLAAALGLGIVLSACGAPDLVSRDAPFEVNAAAGNSGFSEAPRGLAVAAQTGHAHASGTEHLLPAALRENIAVSQINVRVPERLKVSEANRYYPLGDIVWREDPIGDRHAQVEKIFRDALATGTAAFQGEVPVILDVEVQRFHSLTEKARYTVGGVHSIKFRMVLRDAKTGEFLSEPHLVEADLDAFGGQQAVNAEARGLTQKVRISNHLAEVIRQELVKPEGYTNARLGFYQAVNKI
ncbi:hypothetical protein KDD17_05860 [Sulfitobacter albidus]|uniref:Lipoprotein n=1 Tax=Sulfitobacter albidus TaxID=2829501 RepID=A0A975JFI6_9RHOB|nr:DUF6778 family protein [Sulfitobacter albidus]QUJ77513.1 hypothetical protein KDD17_05860 [Sulfitobacter albidus]